MFFVPNFSALGGGVEISTAGVLVCCFFGWRPQEADQNTSKRHGSKAYCNKQPTAPLRDCEANHCAGTPKKKIGYKTDSYYLFKFL